MDYIKDFLMEYRDEKYAVFQRRLINNIPPERIIGVRTPMLRKRAANMYREFMADGSHREFLNGLPHEYFEENQIHGFVISEMKDFEMCISFLEKFLPHVDNWATCDQTSPKVFKRSRELLVPYIDRWIESGRIYTVRFGIKTYMEHFLDEEFDSSYMDKVVSVRTEEYYVRMVIAWYMATALAKQWDRAVTVIEEGVLDKWTHNKTIQKAKESFRISDDRKRYLNTLKR